jgi:hypothetical protein
MPALSSDRDRLLGCAGAEVTARDKRLRVAGQEL